jgi:tetratricopeptide (TPR) repeat protein
LHDPTADTVVANAASDDTEPASAANARVRPARPRGEGADYETLHVVDPEHYVLVREIARGGMGRIHVARDRRLGREVAVKEVLGDAATARRRFEREARITARLQHPSIVSVHEAGTWPSGEPFYAMKLVPGRSLEEAIGDARTWSERIALVPAVIAIADAMAYAHGHRVIHRDLKPRNVLVGEYGETVVIDWGLAKDLAADPATSSFELVASLPGVSSETSSGPGETTIGDVIGTPAYMPPEQADGSTVDERADVYAIGAILYHVLAARPPFAGSTKTELLAAVRRGIREPLAEAAPEVPSELAAIVERAMAGDAAARYGTARELAEDLRRFQTGQLVGAHTYSPRQLLRRWLRRHRTALIAGAAALVAAAAIGVVAVTRIVEANHRVEEQRAVAVTNQQKSEELMHFMLTDLAKQLKRAGRLDLIDSIARRASTYYDQRGAESDDDLRLGAAARADLGQVFGKRGDLVAASVELEKARAIFATLAARTGDPVTEVAAANASVDLAGMELARGDLPLATMRAQDALAMAERAYATDRTKPGVAHAVLSAHGELGDILETRGDLDGAIAEYQRTLELAAEEAKAGEGHAAQDAIDAHGDLARMARHAKHDLPAALRESREVLRIASEQAVLHAENPSWRADVASAHGDIGHILIDQKDYAGAEAELVAATAISDRLVVEDPSNTDWASSRSNLYEKVGMIRFARKDYPGAAAAYRTSHDIDAALAARHPESGDLQRDESLMANKLGDVQLAMNDIDGAVATYRAALATREKLVARDPSNAIWRRDLFYSHVKVAGAFESDPKRQRLALDELHAALAIAEDNAARNPSNVNSAADVIGTHEEIGNLLVDSHDLAGARTEYAAALTLSHQLAARPGGSEGKDYEVALTGKLAKLGGAPR